MAMKTKLSRKQMFFNKINLTQDDDVYIGIDAHKDSYNIGIWLNDAPAIDYTMPANNKKLIKDIEKIRPAIKNIVYEAGPTGYTLARELQKQDIPVQVIAPAITPRPATKQTKTDRLDCRKLAQYAAKGLLRPVAIPTKQQEADRQLTRMRAHIVDKLKRIKIQIKSFLLQHGIEQPAGLKNWSREAVNSLKKINLNECLRFSLDLMLEQLEFLKNKLKEVESKLKELFEQKRHNKKIELMQTHPGVGPVVAGVFRTEIFNPKRFKDKAQIAKYIGLSPQITQSGQSMREGPIIKTGRAQLRSTLIQAAWIWVAKDPAAKRIYRRLLVNTAQPNKAIVAMARRLAVNLWKISCNNHAYIAPVY